MYEEMSSSASPMSEVLFNQLKCRLKWVCGSAHLGLKHTAQEWVAYFS